MEHGRISDVSYKPVSQVVFKRNISKTFGTILSRKLQISLWLLLRTMALKEWGDENITKGWNQCFCSIMNHSFQRRFLRCVLSLLSSRHLHSSYWFWSRTQQLPLLLREIWSWFRDHLTQKTSAQKNPQQFRTSGKDAESTIEALQNEPEARGWIKILAWTSTR